MARHGLPGQPFALDTGGWLGTRHYIRQVAAERAKTFVCRQHFESNMMLRLRTVPAPKWSRKFNR